jgi:hypothetical protein
VANFCFPGVCIKIFILSILLFKKKGLTSYWLADGTFRSSPQKFLQSYSIYGRTEWGIHPFVHIAMCDRKQEEYELVFKGLLDYTAKNGIILQPINLMLDFEQAAAKAFLTVSKYSSVIFCHFHYYRSLWRRVQKLGILFHIFYFYYSYEFYLFKLIGFTSSFRQESARRELANLFGLPLIPLEHIFTVFEEIAS